jgi:hypothetical protein
MQLRPVFKLPTGRLMSFAAAAKKLEKNPLDPPKTSHRRANDSL